MAREKKNYKSATLKLSIWAKLEKYDFFFQDLLFYIRHIIR